MISRGKMGATSTFVVRRLQIYLLAVLLALSTLCSAEDTEETTPTPTVTEAPIYLPYYEAQSWSLVRGSIISSDAEASETTYTIFCPAATPPACDLQLDFPFIIVGGPHTVKFHGTYTSTFIATVECELNSTTAATCSGYTSYADGYDDGLHTGPTEIEWTSTLAGSEVEWGTLTMEEVPTITDDPIDLSVSGITPPPETTVLGVDLSSTTAGVDGGRLSTRKAWAPVFIATITLLFLA